MLEEMHMLEESQENSFTDEKDDHGADVIATVALISFVLLAVIHFCYTGGLPAFFEKVF